MKIASKAVHAGDRRKPAPHIPTTTPIYTASTYCYETTEQLDKVFGEEAEGYSYSRYGNPTNDALEELLTSLEGGDFYASTGVEFDDYTADAGAVAVHVRPVGDTRYRISLIGPDGVIETVHGHSARFPFTGRRGYARLVVDDSNGARAWGQPIFLD